MCFQGMMFQQSLLQLLFHSILLHIHSVTIATQCRNISCSTNEVCFDELIEPKSLNSAN